jgi:hypothetical protein
MISVDHPEVQTKGFLTLKGTNSLARERLREARPRLIRSGKPKLGADRCDYAWCSIYLR